MSPLTLGEAESERDTAAEAETVTVEDTPGERVPSRGVRLAWEEREGTALAVGAVLVEGSVEGVQLALTLKPAPPCVVGVVGGVAVAREVVLPAALEFTEEEEVVEAVELSVPAALEVANRPSEALGVPVMETVLEGE